MISKITSMRLDRIFVFSQEQLHIFAMPTQNLHHLWTLCFSRICFCSSIPLAFDLPRLTCFTAWYKRPTARYFYAILLFFAWSTDRSHQEVVAALHQWGLCIAARTSIGEWLFVKVEQVNWRNIADIGMICFSRIVVDWLDIVLK